MNEKWTFWTVVKEDELEESLELWIENEEVERFGELKFNEFLHFGEGQYGAECLKDLAEYIRQKPGFLSQIFSR